MRAITKYINIYKEFWKVAGVYSVMYRFDTVMLLLGVVIALALNTVFFSLIFKSTPKIGGWSLFEIIFLLGVFQMSWGVFKVFYGKGIENTIDRIFNGQYDFYLLKPINERFLSFFLPPMFKGIPSIVVSIIFIFWSLPNVDISNDARVLALFFIYLIIGQIVAFYFLQIPVSLSFFSGRSDAAFAVFEDIFMFARYPQSVFTGKVFDLFLYVIPITVFASYPTALLIGKIKVSYVSLAIPLLISLTVFFMSNHFYKFGVKYYSSASS